MNGAADTVAGRSANELTDPAHPLFVTVDEAARMLSLGRSTVYRLAKVGELPSHRFGTSVRIPLTALLALANPRSEEEA